MNDPRLAMAVKAADSPFTTYLVSPWSRYVARAGARRGVRPDAVTVTSFVLGVAAAGLFATGERWGLVCGALVLQASFALDCVDGQLARYAGTGSPFGAWLDATCDRLKEWLVYGGLALGSAEPVWVLAGIALTVQTFSHLMGLALPPGPRPPSAVPGTSLRRVAYFPIGERLFAISVTAALFDAETVFWVVIVGAGFGALYGFLGRLRRTRSLEWLVNALMVAALFVALIGLGGDEAFAVLIPLAFHNYDRFHRPAHLGRTPAGWLMVLETLVLVVAFVEPEWLPAAGGILAVLFAAECAADLRKGAAE